MASNRQIAEKRRAVEAARAALAAAEFEYDEAREQEAEPPAGSRILITARFPHGGTKYDYLALRAEKTVADTASWYVTGQRGRLTWEDVLHLVRNADYEVHRLTFVQR